jgi:hypothetical protein
MELKDNKAILQFVCIDPNDEQCVYYRTFNSVKCVHSQNGLCLSAVSNVNKAVLFLKYSGIEINTSK